MSLFVDIFQGLGSIAIGIVNLYIWIIIITAILSFVNPDPYNPIVQTLYRLSNPAYIFVRRYIKTNINGIDFAPFIIVVALEILIVLLSSILRAMF